MSLHSNSTLEKWSVIVNNFTESNSSPKEYCIRTGVNINTLYSWRQRFGLTGKVPTAELKKTSFNEIEFSEDSTSTVTDSIEIIFSDKIKIFVTGHYDESYLSKTVKAVSAALC